MVLCFGAEGGLGGLGVWGLEVAEMLVGSVWGWGVGSGMGKERWDGVHIPWNYYMYFGGA